MAVLHAIEATGVLETNGMVRLDEASDLPAGTRAKAILLTSEDEIGESEWLRAISRNPAFDFLRDPSEDIYGQPGM